MSLHIKREYDYLLVGEIRLILVYRNQTSFVVVERKRADFLFDLGLHVVHDSLIWFLFTCIILTFKMSWCYIIMFADVRTADGNVR
jgi:hypothetical protein